VRKGALRPAARRGRIAAVLLVLGPVWLAASGAARTGIEVTADSGCTLAMRMR
jgi:hypothetical protein